MLYSFKNGRENAYTKVTLSTQRQTRNAKSGFRLTFYQKILSRSFWRQFWCWTWRKLDPWKVKKTLTWLVFWKVGIIYLPGWQETSKVVSSPWWTGSMSDDNVDNFTCHPTTPIWTTTNVASDLNNFNWK